MISDSAKQLKLLTIYEGGGYMKFHKGMYFKIKRTNWIYRIDAPIHVFSKPAWLCFRLPTGNCIEGRYLFFEDILEKQIQNNEVEIMKGV